MSSRQYCPAADVALNTLFDLTKKPDADFTEEEAAHQQDAELKCNTINKQLPPLHIGQKVLVKLNEASPEWAEGKIQHSSDASYNLQIGNRQYRQNRAKV
ncbi:unnamed protein product [Nesidiocoris tenuis]|uniref:Uncharacterized protein n=1 Tax=Nesidiocoris tenuis TaxID=355587 RepID=A0A6H5G920_9HEMI|nr:unnamed protein product [Nesidiocoris tenuis]